MKAIALLTKDRGNDLLSRCSADSENESCLHFELYIFYILHSVLWCNGSSDLNTMRLDYKKRMDGAKAEAEQQQKRLALRRNKVEEEAADKHSVMVSRCVHSVSRHCRQSSECAVALMPEQAEATRHGDMQ